jgi:hypothetical protein
VEAVPAPGRKDSIMELESARALKHEARLQVRALWEQDTTRRALGVHAQAIGRASRPRTIAVGVAPGNANDYKLAVRVQNPLLMDSPEVQSLRDMAKGEADIRFIGAVRKAQAPVLQGRLRPLRIGCSVGHVRITAGTLGAFVQDANQTTMMLSNNHVLANENNASSGDHILQPGHFDGGNDPADAVASLTTFKAIDFQNPNLVDCAAATIMPGIQFDPGSLDELGQLAGVRTDPLVQNEAVAKLGRTTGLTRGVITAVELDNVTVGYDAGDAIFDNQIEILTPDGTAFSQGGDSGSLIVDSNQLAVGLLFAGNDSGITFANPIDEVFKALSVRLFI